MAFQDLAPNDHATAVLIDAYRKCFSGKNRSVLEHMLLELGFFDPDPVGELEPYTAAYRRGQQDYAKRLLRLCGVWNEANVSEIVQAFLDVGIKPAAEGSE